MRTYGEVVHEKDREVELIREKRHRVQSKNHIGKMIGISQD